MLDEKRIKEAENNVRSYLEERLITKETFKNIIYDNVTITEKYINV